MSPRNGPDARMRRPWLRFGLRAGLLVLLTGGTVLLLASDHILPESSPYARGQLVLIESGCQSCHGHGGTGGASNPERGSELRQSLESVPSLLSQNPRPEVLRQWITDGIGGTQARSAAYRAERERDLLRRQIELLRTWIRSGMAWPPGTRLRKPRVEVRPA